MFYMATITRDEIIQRAESAFMVAGYYYGGNYWSNPFYVKYVGSSSRHINPWTKSKTYYPVVPTTIDESPYIACDCAAYVGWCWAIAPDSVGSWDFTSGGRFGKNFRPRKRTKDIAIDFAGIQKGDALWKDGHVALFCGDYVLELSSSDWPNTTNKHGGNRRGLWRVLEFDGYCSFDGTFSTDFTPPAQNPETFIPEGSTQQSLRPPDMSSDLSTLYPYNIQYTKRYVLLKSARRY